MKKLKIIQRNEIDLAEVIKIWNEKVLILTVIIIFIVLGQVYGALQTKIYKAEIILSETPEYLFIKTPPFYSKIQTKQFEKENEVSFDDQFILNLFSFKFLDKFTENNEK